MVQITFLMCKLFKFLNDTDHSFIMLSNYSFKVYKIHTCSINNKSKGGNIKLPEEPQNCCMSGCANCVWIEYAKEVARILNDEGEMAYEKINEHVKDPNLKAFLMLEMQQLFKKNKT